LGEVQNLKADALEMVTKMALEYEDEVAGAEKRRSLSQEAFCLQIILSMKTDEMRNLREQVAITEQKLEQSENSKKKLSLVLARIEDLKEQIRIKDEAQRQLLVEKNELEESVADANMAVQRMSQNIAELSQRIRAGSGGYDSLKCDEEINTKTPYYQDVQQTQDVTLNEVFEDTSAVMDEIKIVRYDDHEEETGEYCDLKNRDSVDFPTIESLDEGLGDISSESEIANSPTPNMPDSAGHAHSQDDNDKQKIVSSENEESLKKSQASLYQTRNRFMFNRRISIETPL